MTTALLSRVHFTKERTKAWSAAAASTSRASGYWSSTSVRWRKRRVEVRRGLVAVTRAVRRWEDSRNPISPNISPSERRLTGARPSGVLMETSTSPSSMRNRRSAGSPSSSTWACLGNACSVRCEDSAARARAGRAAKAGMPRRSRCCGSPKLCGGKGKSMGNALPSRALSGIVGEVQHALNLTPCVRASPLGQG